MLVAVIDDNAVNLKVYVNVISHIPGVQTKTFQSSAEGLAWCTNNELDLLVLDYHMPPPDGVTFIKEYRKAKPAAQTPIIMITGEQDKEIRRQALDVGASDFISKPADPVEFVARVRNLLSAVESRRELMRQSAAATDQGAQALHAATMHEAEAVNLLMRAVGYRENRSGMEHVRIGEYAALLARLVGRTLEEQRLLLIAAPLHDVGKVGIPDSILLKPGGLTAPELSVVHRHPELGHAILVAGSATIFKLGAEIALGHHERWDGEGYPEGIAGERIPLAARIVAVADAFEAMLSEKPYRHALPFEKAFEELHRQAGVFFDPAIVAAALSHREEMLAVASQFGDGMVAR
jgi:putative two-component system response regulator